MAQIDCHPLRQIFCLDDYLPLASGVTSITCNKWITFICPSPPCLIRLHIPGLMNLNSESQICLLSYVYGFQLQDPVWARTVDLKWKDVQNPDPDLKKIELTLMNLNILLLGWNLPVRLNRQGLVRIHCRLALGSQTSNCPSCVCKAKRKPMHFFRTPKKYVHWRWLDLIVSDLKG